MLWQAPVVCPEGFEPSTIRLKVGCSTTELRAHKPAEPSVAECSVWSGPVNRKELWHSVPERRSQGSGSPSKGAGRQLMPI